MLASFISFSQSEKFPSPDYVNEVAYCDTVHKTLSSLESKKFKPNYKTGTFGFNQRLLLTVDGPASPVRFKHDQPLVFVLKVEAMFKDRDPAEHLAFTRLDVKKKNRSLTFSQGKPFTKTKINSMETEGWKFKKIADDVVEITFDKIPENGEYCFYTIRAGFPYAYFAFGID